MCHVVCVVFILHSKGDEVARLRITSKVFTREREREREREIKRLCEFEKRTALSFHLSSHPQHFVSFREEKEHAIASRYTVFTVFDK